MTANINIRTVFLFMIIFSVIAIIVSVITKLSLGETFFYTLWSDRELYRAFHLAQTPQFSGPESNFGGRIPGGAAYYGIWLLQAIDPSVVFIRAALVILQAIGAAFLFLAARTVFSTPAALVAAALFLVIPNLYDTLNSVWNPGFTFIFIGAAYYLLAKCLKTSSFVPAIGLGFLVSIGSQFQFSLFLLLPVVILILGYRRILPTIPQLLLFLTAVLLPFGPYLLWDYSNDFSNLNELVSYRALTGSEQQQGMSLFLRLADRVSILFSTLLSWRNYAVPEFRFGWIVWLGVACVESAPFVLMLALAPVFLIFRKSVTQADPANKRLMFCVDMAVIMFSTPVILGVLDIPFPPRYNYYALPAFVFLAAAVVEIFVLLLREKPNAVVAALLILISSIAPASAVVFAVNWPRVLVAQPSVYNYSHYRELGEFAAGTLHVSDVEAPKHLAAVTLMDDGSVVTPLVLNSAMAYPVALAARRMNINQPLSDPRNICALAIRGQSNQPVDRDAAEAVLSPFKEVIGRYETLSFEARGLFSYLTYIPDSGNCLRTLNNRYIYYPEEQAFEAKIKDLGYGGHVLASDAPNTVSAGIKLPAKRDILIGFNLTAKAAKLHIEMVSNSLRGYTGIVDNNLSDARLEFHGCNETIAARLPQRLFSDAKQSFVLPPWNMAVELKPECDYAVSFHASNLTSETVQLGVISIELIEKYRLPVATSE